MNDVSQRFSARKTSKTYTPLVVAAYQKYGSSLKIEFDYASQNAFTNVDVSIWNVRLKNVLKFFFFGDRFVQRPRINPCSRGNRQTGVRRRDDNDIIMSRLRQRNDTYGGILEQSAGGVTSRSRPETLRRNRKVNQDPAETVRVQENRT